jgi:hypothetical protein
MTPPTTTRAKRTASKFVLLFFPLCLGSPSAAASRAFLASGALCLRLPRCVAFWWNFPLARVVFAWPDVASPSVQLGLPVRWAGVTAPCLFLGSLCDHAETDARKFNSAPSRRRRMLSAGALSAGSTNPRSQGRRRGSASRFGCTAESRSSVPPRPPARRDVYEWPKSDILRSQGGLVVAYLRLIP